MSERRREKRYRCTLWVRFGDGGQGEWAAISRNVSRTGLLMALGPKLEVGTTLKLSFRVDPAQLEEHRLEGRIVRLDENAEDRKGLWPHRVAVEFDEPLPEVEILLRELPGLSETTS